jgi:phosphoribosylaminoimidazolecarboxamide formyltransferase/IMP cyclohydrolase
MAVEVTPPGPTQDVRPVRRALISVFDKTGLEDLVRGLARCGRGARLHGRVGSAHRWLGLPVTRSRTSPASPSASRAGSRPCTRGCTPGCSPTRASPTTLAQLAELDVAPFDLVVVNLYPFTATVASGASPDECVENIDIGGPSMVRAAAKNHPSVAVVTSPMRYPRCWLPSGGGFTFAQRQRLAAEAFVHTAAYDVAVASLDGQCLRRHLRGHGLPGLGGRDLDQGRRSCATARTRTSGLASTATASRMPGLARPSSCTARRCPTTTTSTPTPRCARPTTRATSPTVAIIKHANPCGIAVGADVADRGCPCRGARLRPGLGLSVA